MSFVTCTYATKKCPLELQTSSKEPSVQYIKFIIPEKMNDLPHTPLKSEINYAY
jgi:hypothetical protein